MNNNGTLFTMETMCGCPGTRKAFLKKPSLGHTYKQYETAETGMRNGRHAGADLASGLGEAFDADALAPIEYDDTSTVVQIEPRS